MVSVVIPVLPFEMFLFGATGDLAKRKIFPALFHRFLAGQFDEKSRIIGIARQKLTDIQFKELVKSSLTGFVKEELLMADKLEGFLDLLSFHSIDLASSEGWQKLRNDAGINKKRVRVFYLSIAPDLILPACKRLSEFGLVSENSRVVVEKPLGTDLKSSQKLNATLASVFSEIQIYRIDHYLGKETVQNLMALRFSNLFLEPIWNSQYIENVQITVAESVTVEGRGGYYDKAGAMRDMVQNHLMQLLCLVAMEPPASFTADKVRDEKLKIIQALDTIKPSDTVRGQYLASLESESYRDHVGVENSDTESFVALKVGISNWRWSQVPFYLRTGKAMSVRKSEITINFKDVPHMIFQNTDSRNANKLSIQLQPDESVTMQISVKEPGPGGMRLINTGLDMSFANLTDVTSSVEAYERLIMDTVRGDQTLFMRGDEVEEAWIWIDQIINLWQEGKDKPYPYRQGTSGPMESELLLQRDGRSWEKM